MFKVFYYQICFVAVVGVALVSSSNTIYISQLINLLVISGDSVALKTYEATLEGYIESWVDRFRSNNEVCNILEAIWEEDKKYFPSLIKN